MLRRLTAKQFLEWEHYARLEPFGELRADYRAALIASVIANVNRGSKQKPYTLEDFLLKFAEEPVRKQTVEDQLAVAKMIAMMYSTTDKSA